MHDVIPDVEVVERRHKIPADLALREILYDIREHAEGEHVRAHEAHDRSREHERSAKARRSLPEGEECKEDRSKDEACRILEWIPERRKKIVDAEAGRRHHVLDVLFFLDLCNLRERFAHCSAEWADL